MSYGAYVHVAMRVAEKLAKDGIQAAVLDLRSLAPLDRDALLALARHCGRVLIVHEDTRTGSIGESLAAIIQEEAFEYLDAPVRIVGALDTPVPYSPPLEEFFLPSEEDAERAGARPSPTAWRARPAGGAYRASSDASAAEGRDMRRSAAAHPLPYGTNTTGGSYQSRSAVTAMRYNALHV